MRFSKLSKFNQNMHMDAKIEINGLEIEVVYKPIKNLHLSVYPPDGRVKISAPLLMNLEKVRLFTVTKLDWIRSQQRKLQAQERESLRKYIHLESHYLWGRRYLLHVVSAANSVLGVRISGNKLIMNVRPDTTQERRQELMADFYRAEIRTKLDKLLPTWTSNMGKSPKQVFIQHMRTMWGSCNYHNQNIRLNTELAKKPIECLEYVLVHELAHLWEPSHNATFIAIMDKHMPRWRERRDLLNSLPVRHESWGA